MPRLTISLRGMPVRRCVRATESFTVWIMGCPFSPLKPAQLAALERPLT
jgi:hypothetical protein